MQSSRLVCGCSSASPKHFGRAFNLAASHRHFHTHNVHSHIRAGSCVAQPIPWASRDERYAPVRAQGYVEGGAHQQYLSDEEVRGGSACANWVVSWRRPLLSVAHSSHPIAARLAQVDELIFDAAGFVCVLDEVRPLDNASYNPFYEVWTRIARIPPEERYRCGSGSPRGDGGWRLGGGWTCIRAQGPDGALGVHVARIA
jgi:hypothetical protein